MLIVVSAVASAVALLGALLVGYSTQNTIAHMIPKRDPGSVLVAFPADVEDQIKQQSMVSTGVAVPEVQPPSPDQMAQTLRDSIAQASAGAVSPTQSKGQPVAATPDLKALAGKLESVLLDKGGDQQNIAALRAYALRELSTKDGSVVLPNFKVDDSALQDPTLSSDLTSQIAELQKSLNDQVAALPELQGRNISTKDIQLGADPQQLSAAIDALGLESDMLGLDFKSDARYDTLQGLGEQLLSTKDHQISLDGLDMNELEQISRDLVTQLGQQDGRDDAPASAGSVDSEPAN